MEHNLTVGFLPLVDPVTSRSLPVALAQHRQALPLPDGPRQKAPNAVGLTTSFTPLRPRLVSLRRKPVQIGSASDVPISMPSTSRLPSALTPVAMMTATETMRPPRWTFK